MNGIQSSFFNTPVASAIPEPLVGNAKLAARFRTMAERLTTKIEDKRRPMSQNPTPKRVREHAQRLHEAANLSRLQLAFIILSNMHEVGICTPILEQLRTIKEIQPMVQTRGESAGYYNYYDSGIYNDTSEAAVVLQELIATSIDPQAAYKAEIDQLNNAARLLVGQIPGFFPTPLPVINSMLDRACIEDHMSVLEPSAGSGSILDALQARHPTVQTVCIEPNVSLRKILTKKGYRLVDSDFMKHTEQYDRVVQNPPFENLQDIDHVLHAFECLKPGGRLVSIMSESPFFRSDKKAAAFRQWLDEHGGWSLELPADAFKESGTNIKTRLIMIDK